MRVYDAPKYLTWSNGTKFFKQHLFIKITQQKLKSHQSHCIHNPQK